MLLLNEGLIKMTSSVLETSYSTNNIHSFPSRPLVTFKYLQNTLIILIKVLVPIDLVLLRTVCMQKSHWNELVVLKQPLCLFKLCLWNNSHFNFSKTRDWRWLHSAGQDPSKHNLTLK